VKARASTIALRRKHLHPKSCNKGKSNPSLEVALDAETTVTSLSSASSHQAHTTESHRIDPNGSLVGLMGVLLREKTRARIAGMCYACSNSCQASWKKVLLLLYRCVVHARTPLVREIGGDLLYHAKLETAKSLLLDVCECVITVSSARTWV